MLEVLIVENPSVEIPRQGRTEEKEYLRALIDELSDVEVWSGC
jgi:hypothetical protein